MTCGHQSRVAALGAIISALCVVGCGQYPGPEEVSVTQSPVIGGQASPAAQDATVIVLNQSAACTGVVVAPTLVLTARSCLFELPNADNGRVYFRCFPAGRGAPLLRALAPIDFVISVGTRPGPRTPEARGIRFYGGDDLDACANNIALIEVDRPLSPAPLAMRLDSGPRLDETGTLVGWGAGAEQFGEPPQVRQQRAVKVLAVGPKPFQPPGAAQLQVGEGSFITGEAGCLSDQGGPFISDETNAVVGILSTLEPADPTLTLDAGLDYCRNASNVFRSLASQRQWIRDAFARTNQVPWLEGHPPLARAGESCTDPGDCSSGLCEETTGGARLCSQDCSSAACPTSLQCVGPAHARRCVPTQVTTTDVASVRCAVGFRTPNSAAWLALALLGIGCLFKRRTKQPPVP